MGFIPGERYHKYHRSYCLQRQDWAGMPRTLFSGTADQYSHGGY